MMTEELTLVVVIAFTGSAFEDGTGSSVLIASTAAPIRGGISIPRILILVLEGGDKDKPDEHYDDKE